MFGKSEQLLRKNILEGNGSISHQQAMEKAEQEFKIYREREMKQLVSDFDRSRSNLLACYSVWTSTTHKTAERIVRLYESSYG